MTALTERHTARLRAHEAGEHETEINSHCPACSLIAKQDGMRRWLAAEARDKLWKAHFWGRHANTAVSGCEGCGNVLDIALYGLSKVLYPPVRPAIPKGFSR